MSAKFDTVLPPIRCSSEFKDALEKMAKKKKKSVSAMIRDDYTEKINQKKP